MELLAVQMQDHIAIVTMNNPPVNAQNQAFFEAVQHTFDALSDNRQARVAILTGAGRCFSAGVDLKSRAAETAGPGAGWHGSRLAREAFHAVLECQKPVIAAINGPALGAGLALAASCDILVAADKAVLGLPEIDVGLLGGGRHAMRLFGHSRVRRMMFTGMRMSGEELYRLGVVEACVPSERLMETALELAWQIAAKSPTAIRLAKRALNAIEFMTLRDGYRFEQDMTAQLMITDDAKEAVMAFLEKRPAVFKD